MNHIYRAIESPGQVFDSSDNILGIDRFKYSIIQTEVICLEWEEYQTRIVGGIKN